MTFGGPAVFDDLLLENLKNASGEPISRAELELESILSSQLQVLDFSAVLCR